MPPSTPPLDRPLLRRFLRSLSAPKMLVVAVCGPHVAGYAADRCPWQLKAIHIEPTETLVGLSMPPSTFNWVGEFEGVSIDLSSSEVGMALALLLRGDGSILERIMSPLQVLPNGDLDDLQAVARSTLSLAFFSYYRDFARSVLRGFDQHPTHTVRRVLQAYRTGLTGLHLIRTGQLDLRLDPLCRKHNLTRLEALVARYRADADAVLDEDSRWIGGLVPLKVRLDRSFAGSPLPPTPPNRTGCKTTSSTCGDAFTTRRRCRTCPRSSGSVGGHGGKSGPNPPTATSSSPQMDLDLAQRGRLVPEYGVESCEGRARGSVFRFCLRWVDVGRLGTAVLRPVGGSRPTRRVRTTLLHQRA